MDVLAQLVEGYICCENCGKRVAALLKERGEAKVIRAFFDPF